MYRIAPAILQDRFSLISKVLMAQLADNETSSSTALLKSVSVTQTNTFRLYYYIYLYCQLVSCVTVLLSVQPPIVWKDTAVHRMLQTVINFTIHPKPRVREIFIATVCYYMYCVFVYICMLHVFC